MTRSARLAIGVLAWALWPGPTPAAESASALDPRVVFAQKLVPVTPAQGGAPTYLQTPHVKVFAAGGRLIAQGLPAQVRPGSSPAEVRAWLSRPATSQWTLAQEFRALAAPVPATGVVMVVYLSEPCPPCEGLVAPLREALTQATAGGLHVHRVRIAS